jgi:hypothetical protein
LKLWELAQRTYEKKVEARNRNGGCAYVIVLGQCSQALRNRIEAHADWNDINVE